jgi:hypothetical protein
MSKNDNVIKDLLAKLEEQKSGLGVKPKAAWATNGVFKFDHSDFFNINVTTDVSKFAAATGFLITGDNAFSKGCDELGLKDQVFKWDGYTREEWVQDFKTRIKIIEYDNRKKLLEATKTKLNGLVSEEARTEMELEDIKKLLA